MEEFLLNISRNLHISFAAAMELTQGLSFIAVSNVKIGNPLTRPCGHTNTDSEVAAAAAAAAVVAVVVISSNNIIHGIKRKQQNSSRSADKVRAELHVSRRH
jgi:hypothetical protein